MKKFTEAEVREMDVEGYFSNALTADQFIGIILSIVLAGPTIFSLFSLGAPNHNDQKIAQITLMVLVLCHVTIVAILLPKARAENRRKAAILATESGAKIPSICRSLSEVGERQPSERKQKVVTALRAQVSRLFETAVREAGLLVESDDTAFFDEVCAKAGLSLTQDTGQESSAITPIERPCAVEEPPRYQRISDR